LIALERCRLALGTQLAAPERRRIQALYDDALAVIAAREITLRKLESDLAHLRSSERIAAITARMGISRATYFRLRNRAK